MNVKVKNILIKVIYAILFLIMLVCFVYLSEKYADNSKDEVYTIRDYYSTITNDSFVPVNGTRFIHLFKNGKHLVFVGSKTSKWSSKYITELDKVVQSLGVDEVLYYDVNNDKAQKNSNYYKVRDLLKNALITTDETNNNLLAPSFYIIDNGVVKYYNIDTVAMKNTIEPETYWTSEKESEFALEITEAIYQYYLNK